MRSSRSSKPDDRFWAKRSWAAARTSPDRDDRDVADAVAGGQANPRECDRQPRRDPLVAIITSASVAADAQITALQSELQRRGLPAPTRFDVPDRTLWATWLCDRCGGFTAADRAHARRSPGCRLPFVEPLLEGGARGNLGPKLASVARVITASSAPKASRAPRAAARLSVHEPTWVE